jgi:hypothetical protein
MLKSFKGVLSHLMMHSARQQYVSRRRACRRRR